MAKAQGDFILLEESVTLTANVDAKRFISPAGAYPVAAGGRVLGVSRWKANNTEETSLIVLGIAVVEAGGAVAVGDPIISDTSGKAIKADNLSIAAGGTTVTSTAANGEIINGGVPKQHVKGIALDAGTSGDEIRVLLQP